MDQQLARIVTDTLVDLALLAIPVVGGYAVAALRRLAADQRARGWLATHRFVDLVARRAVLAVEQTLRSEPAAEKKRAAVARALADLSAHGVPLTAARLAALDDAVEAQVLLLLTAAGAELRGATVALPAVSGTVPRPTGELNH